MGTSGRTLLVQLEVGKIKTGYRITAEACDTGDSTRRISARLGILESKQLTAQIKTISIIPKRQRLAVSLKRLFPTCLLH